jgi:sugar lactone lactonase YvrE
LLLAAERGFSYLRPEGELRPLAEVAPAGTRMNDAACDPQGRFWPAQLPMINALVAHRSIASIAPATLT